MEELGLPELTSEQIEELCIITEETAKRYILSKVPSKRIDTLDISVEGDGTKPVRLKIEIDVTLSPLMKHFDQQKLVDEAVKEAFRSAGEYLRELKCHSKK